jgi:diguanylate cyclase (GGDEF)-like protein/PAS domain S-box-containing protein
VAINGVRKQSPLIKPHAEPSDAVSEVVPPVPPTPQALTAEGRSAALADLLRQATQASLDPDAVLEVAVRWCARVLGDRAGVWTLAHADDALQPGPLAHAREEEDAPAPVLDAALAQRAVQRHTTVADAGRMVAPLRSRGRVLGVLAVEHADAARAYRREDAELLGEVAARVGLVLDNARLYDRVRVQATTLEHVDAAVCAVDADGRITSFNPAAERMFGYDEAEVLGRSPLDVVSAETPERLAEAREGVVAHGRHSSPWRLRRKDGECFDGHIHTVVVNDESGAMKGMVAVYQDLSERLALIAALERKAAQQAAVAALGERALEAEHPTALVDRAVELVRQTLQIELVALFELVDEGRTLALGAGAGFPDNYVGSATVPAGWADGQEGFTLIRREPVIVDDARRERRFVQADLVGALGAISGISVVVQGHGRTHAVLAAYASRPGAFTPDDVAFLQSIANVLGDALDRFAGEEEIRHRGLHDPLTELPNRTLVLERLAQAIARVDHSGPAHPRVALLFLDLDHFKNINDGLGHRAGDDVLCQVADRLRAAVRPVDTVGRFGGDEFVVLCEDVADEEEATTIARRLLEAFSKPFRAGGDHHVVGVSIGVALMDAGHDAILDPDALLRDADAAMYRAKEAGRSRIEVFDMGMREWAVDRLATEAALRRALERDDELVVHYQPVVDLADGAIAAVEALVRWHHPERGLLGPDHFVGVAEDSGLIVPLGRRVLELACAQAAAWAAARGVDRPVLPVHVNLSPRQLHDQALVETVQAALASDGVAPGTLALEITEGTLIDRGVDRVALLERLRDLGVALVLDDFGTGWSSLARLAELPIGGLKVDRSFVADIDDRGGPIVDAIVRLARAFDLPVVAEGIETLEQLAALDALDCGLGQGFLFARALPAAELTPLVVAREPAFGAIVSRRRRPADAGRA